MAEETGVFWTAGFLNERFPAPVSPLGWSVVGALVEKRALREPLRFMGYRDADRIPATRLYHGHPYANVLVFQILYNPFPAALVPVDAVRYFPQGDLEWRRRAPYPGSIWRPRLIFSLLAHFVRDPLTWSPANFWQWTRYARRHEVRVAALNTRLDRARTPREILDVLGAAERAHSDLLKIHRWSLTYADIFYKGLTHLAGESAQALISDVPNLTRRVNADLAGLAQRAADAGLDFGTDRAITAALTHPGFAPAVEDFLRAHGHRSFSLDLAQPTFREEPAQFLRLLDATAEPPPAGSEWRLVRDAVRTRLPRYERPLFDAVLAFARLYAQLREDQRYYWQKSLAVTRRAYLLLGAELCSQKVISEPAEIMYATREEVARRLNDSLAAGELAARIHSRRAEWDHYRQEYLASPARAYPAFLHGDEPLDFVEAGAAARWQGRGVSPGRTRGPARVVLEARDLARVAPGEILVAPATDPGWTPVFGRLAGLVMERGGVLAHGAILAREYRLPAVAGIPGITRQLTDGDWVEVDGTRGVVRRISPAPAGEPAQQ